MAPLLSRTATTTHRQPTLLDAFILLTLLTAATTLIVLGILALLSVAPFCNRRLVTAIIVLIIAGLCLLAIACYMVLLTHHQHVHVATTNTAATAYP